MLFDFGEIQSILSLNRYLIVSERRFFMVMSCVGELHRRMALMFYVDDVQQMLSLLS